MNGWAKIAAAVFGLWAVMIPIGVGMIRDSISEAQKAITLAEHRLTVIEEQLKCAK